MKTLITIVVIIGVAAVAGSIFVGVKSFDGIVTEHPYEKGLRWDDVRHKKLASGWDIEIWNNDLQTGENDIVILVIDKEGNPVAGSSISVMISRPSTGTYNEYFDTVSIKEGVFKVHVNFPLYGYWDLMTNVTKGGDSLLFEKRIFVEKERRERQSHSGMDKETACLINSGPCISTIEHEGMDVTFEINPKPVVPMKGLIFNVTLKDREGPVTDASVTVDLTMPGMFMGINRAALIHTGDGNYEGQGIIQTCPHGGRTWRADIWITRQDKTASVGFIFGVD